MLYKYFISIAAFLGALTVALGAFGAHALKAELSPAALITYETAVRYQMYHVVALLITGILINRAASPKEQKLLSRVGLFFYRWHCPLFRLLVFYSGKAFFRHRRITMGRCYNTNGWPTLDGGMGSIGALSTAKRGKLQGLLAFLHIGP